MKIAIRLLTLCMCITSLLYASLSDEQFKSIISLVKTIDLESASDAQYHNYITSISQVGEQGTQQQKDFLEGVLAGADTQAQLLDPEIEQISTLLENDVITPSVWKTFVQLLQTIQNNGTLIQQNQIKTLLIEKKERLESAIKNLVFSTLKSIEVQQILKAVVIGAVYGVLPGVGFKALSILAGNMSLTQASTQLVDVGVLSALDAFARYATRNAPEAVSATFAGAASIALQDFMGYAGTRPVMLPFFGPLGGPLTGALYGIGITVTHQELARRGTIKRVLANLNWRDMAVGQQAVTVPKENEPVVTFIKNSLQKIIAHPTVRNAVATTVTYAAEGALMGAVMHTLGLGFYQESTITSALAQSMIRGALEGLYQLSHNGQESLGIVQRMQGGFVAHSVQQFITTGTTQLDLFSLTPVVVQQATTGAINSIVRTSGGWGGFMRTILGR